MTQPTADTFEFRSCILGCDKCAAELADPTVTDDKCFNYCKTYNYGKAGIRKGIIEPDKACLIGCVINTCQEVCWGGTTDQNVTPANQQYWWGQGGHGCSLKMGMGYVQNPDYANPDSPGGQGASVAVRQCCTNAFNLCNYNGNTGSTNYKNVLLVTQRSCASFVPSKTQVDICAFYANPQNCGSPGMGP